MVIFSVICESAMNIDKLYYGHCGQQEEQHFGNIADTLQYLVIDHEVSHLGVEIVKLELGMRLDKMIKGIG